MNETLPAHVDVAIVGTGTAGRATALACARRGLRTLAVDRRPVDASGAHWINGVAAWQFDAAEIPRPEPPEEVGDCPEVYLIAGYGPTRIKVDTRALLEVDMRYLVRRLGRLAREAGATLVGGVRVSDVRLRADGGVIETDQGTVHARWIVDATGLAGKVGPAKPRVAPAHLCAAAQQVHTLTDREAARAFFGAHEAQLDDVLSFTGIAGGFSLLSVRAHGDEVALLTGSIPAMGHPSGKAILDDFVARSPWIGTKVFGGAAAIPLRRPLDQLAVGCLGRIGDAACQVFSAHGSGVGPALVAARLLAESLASGQGMQGYAVSWQRKYGGLHASYDLFRRFSQTLDGESLAHLMQLGLLDGASGNATLMQRLPRFGPRTVPTKLRALFEQPGLAPKIAGVGARMVAAQALYAAYPKHPKRLRTWSKRVARLFGEAPDVLADGLPN